MSATAVTTSKGIFGLCGAATSFVVASLTSTSEWLQILTFGAGLIVAILSGISLGFDIRHKIHLAKQDSRDDKDDSDTRQGKQQYS